MEQGDRERKSRRIFYTLIITLLISYIGLKSWHVVLALDVYEGQPLERSTYGAAK